MRLANPPLYDTITGNRSTMGAYPYIAYCVNCREVFATRGKESTHILDIAFDIPITEKMPSIDEKRENAIKVKQKMYKDLMGEEFVTEPREWNSIELIIDENLAASVDKKLIALSDIKEAIWNAEKADDKFIDEEDGVCQCSMVKSALTYWVQYKKTNSGAFEVYGAYYHRMKIGEEA